MEKQWFKISNKRWVVGLILLATGVTGFTIFYTLSRFILPGESQETIPKTIIKTPERKITALGRIEPQSEVIRVGVSMNLTGDRLAQLLVKEGDLVKKGELIGVLDSRDRLQSILGQTEEQVKIAQARLAQIKAGAKTGEITAQKATIGRLQAQWEGEKNAQQAVIGRLQAQWEGEKNAQQAVIERLQAQWEGEKNAQQATFNKLLAELKNAELEYQRNEQLYHEGGIAQSTLDSKRLLVETTRQQLTEIRANLQRIDLTFKKQVAEAQVNLERINHTFNKQLEEGNATFKRINNTGLEQLDEAQATLDKIAEVRPVDIQLAQAEVKSALAQVERAKVELEQAYIRAPMTGKVLKVHTKIGEKISDQGVIEIGQTGQMVVVAEVYQTDIKDVKIGQKAMIKSQALTQELTGMVKEIGLQVKRQNVFSNQPGENLDSRVVEVKIYLNDSQPVSHLTNLQVEVFIDK